MSSAAGMTKHTKISVGVSGSNLRDYYKTPCLRKYRLHDLVLSEGSLMMKRGTSASFPWKNNSTLHSYANLGIENVSFVAFLI